MTSERMQFALTFAVLIACVSACNLQSTGDMMNANDANANMNDNSMDPNDGMDANDNTNDNTNANDSATQKLAVFQDPDSEFSTTDVRDIDEEIFQFNTDDMTMILEVDGSTDTGWPVNDNLLGAAGSFQVRFGTVAGERRAYFTETGPATICDIVVTDGNFTIFPTTTTVPQ